MKLYTFGSEKLIGRDLLEKINRIADLISVTTDTNDLVVALYVVQKSNWSGGTAYAHYWNTPDKFCTGRGKWKITRRFNTPQNLPPKFKLVRLLLRHNPSKYPLTERDYYGWEHTYATFEDHFSFLFAHELHHFRRFHLGIHQGEGENSANKWAFNHVKSLNFNIESKKLKVQKIKYSKKKTIEFHHVFNPKDFIHLNTLSGEISWKQVLNSIFINISPQKKKLYIAEKLGHFEILRSLDPGMTLLISYDPKQKYSNQTVTLVRSLRKNSVRIVIRTNDGKEWRWPMAWLKLEN